MISLRCYPGLARLDAPGVVGARESRARSASTIMWTREEKSTSGFHPSAVRAFDESPIR